MANKRYKARKPNGQQGVGLVQGGVISPILANIYLHYVLDVRFYKVVRQHCLGEAHMIRYADDFVCCFQYQEDVKRFYRALLHRLNKFNLELAEEKSRLIAFGRNAEAQSKERARNWIPLTFWDSRTTAVRARKANSE